MIGSQTWKRLELFFAVLTMVLCFFIPTSVRAQTSSSTGSLNGTVTDPENAVVPDAKVTVSNLATGTSVVVSTNAVGFYSTGALTPGVYTVRVTAPSFKTTTTTVTVQVGQAATANVKLELGSSKEVVEVSASALTVNETQPEVQDVLTAKDIAELPVNGRNFLDLATLEPGVQIQDGATFDPTKNGYSSLSFGGRFGRTARIEVDGVDISDETVGTTTQNIPQSAIQEFQVGESTLDMSTELTSSGTVNVVTKSGTNTWHGEAFYYGRSDQTSARIAPEQLNFGRKQFGGNFGGAIIKDKLFFFADVERTDQSLQNPVQLAGDFSSLSGSFNSPFNEREYLARLDYNIRSNWTMFYRFNYDQNLSLRGFNPGVYQPFENVDHVPTHVLGTDFSTSRTTNSIRFEYLKFRNAIVDGVGLSGAQNPVPGISLNITPDGNDFTCLDGGEAYCSGTNILAPQATFQSDKQTKYDGSYSLGRHTLRYGIAFNKILGGGYAKFFGIEPMVQSVFNSANETIAAAGPYPDGASNPLNWPVDTILFGNGQGYFTELSGFGLPAGGQYDNRLEWYVGDQWKMKSNLTVTAGLHYGRDTGRSDSDLPGIPALAQFDNQYYHGLEDPVNQPNLNFGPQLGIAWDPWKSGKTVFRGGIGLYYENAIFNNVLFDRPARLQQGLFFGTAAPCFGGQATGAVQGVNNGNPVGYCGEPIGQAAAQIAADQTAYQEAVEAAGPQSNGSFVGNALAEGVQSTGDQLISPDYISPRSVQMNFGLQRQLGKSSVLSVDYVRNVSTHFLIGLDTNKDGDARFLNVPNAQAAISATNSSLGCGTGTDTAAIQCAIAAGATMADYAGNGLDSGVDYAAGFPCPTCAFPGVNPNVGQNQMLFPIGRSVYNGLLVSLKSNLSNPLPGIRRLSLITSYTLSRFDSEVQDQDFVNNATDFNNPLSYFGPSALDRTHQVSVGAVMDLPAATRLALTTHWDTAPAQTLLLQQSGLPGEIFYTDITGDGTTGDVAPGTNVGAFGRSIKASDLNNYINMYNSKYAGQLTPAGQALVAAGLFTQAQLVSLGAVTPTLQLAPSGNVGLSPLFTFDAHISWEIHLAKMLHALPERVVLEPQIALYNVFNFHNYDPGGNLLSGVLGGLPGQVNGTTKYDQAGCPANVAACTGRTNLITPGSASGVNWYAVPRQAEFGVRLSF
ncbi:MAG TPA: TonB-dependent receptor [Candidatus Acidoferrum sp.]|nr:TonB-dependent receptor [Candidatus Acidoferrum sp.]